MNVEDKKPTTLEVVASSCLETIECISDISGDCEVHIGRNISEAMSKKSIVGAINESISTKSLTLNASGDIFYVARLNMSQIEGNFSLIESKFNYYSIINKIDVN